MISFRHAQLNDLDSIMTIINHAIDNLRIDGVPQWQNGSPNRDILRDDIQNNHTILMFDNDRLVATLCLMFDEEPTYKSLSGGSWINNGKYATIHRIAAAPNAHRNQYASMLLIHCIKLAQSEKIHSIRIDTHQDNHKMLGLIAKFHFTPCGTITLSDGSSRVAFELLI